MLLLVTSSPGYLISAPAAVALRSAPAAVALRSAALPMSASDPLRRAADTSGDSVDLGDAADDAASRLEARLKAASDRLNDLGASEVPRMPEPAGPTRSGFSKSTTNAAEMEERLRRLRLRGTGALEAENLAAIEGAMKMAKQWAGAGLHDRAKKELLAVEPFVSCRTDLGAAFNLQLADAAEQSGEKGRARNLRQKVMTEAESSAQRWQAERRLSEGSPGGTQSSSPSSGSNPELSQLFRMPDQWS